MEHGSRTRLLTAAVLVVVFGTGVVLGLAADSKLGAPAAEASIVGDSVGTTPERSRRTPMYAQMNPTAEQSVLIDSIVAVQRERTNALDKRTRAAYRHEFRQIYLDTREAIKRVFTPEQAAEYQRRLDEWDAQQAAERETEGGRR